MKTFRHRHRHHTHDNISACMHASPDHSDHRRNRHATLHTSIPTTLHHHLHSHVARLHPPSPPLSRHLPTLLQNSLFRLLDMNVTASVVPPNHRPITHSSFAPALACHQTMRTLLPSRGTTPAQHMPTPRPAPPQLTDLPAIIHPALRQPSFPTFRYVPGRQLSTLSSAQLSSAPHKPGRRALRARCPAPGSSFHLPTPPSEACQILYRQIRSEIGRAHV